MTTDITLGNQRLLQLAEILDTADERHRERGERAYDQTSFAHHCGTPACAAGHWMASNPDTWDLREVQTNDGMSPFFGLCRDFQLKDFEYSLLFSKNGCDSAKTAKDAASYIRGFVARRQS